MKPILSNESYWKMWILQDETTVSHKIDFKNRHGVIFHSDRLREQLLKKVRK